MVAFPESELQEFLVAYPVFTIIEENGVAALCGPLTIFADGEDFTFEVKIVPIEEYPNLFPHVYELSSTFPKIIDWHVYSDESFCFTVSPVEALACKRGITLLKFVNGWIKPYLANQRYRMREGKYANGEYSHDLWGLVEYYGPLLNTTNLFFIEEALNVAITTKKIERVSFCYCGSGKKYRHCHKKATETLWEIGDELLQRHQMLFHLLILKQLTPIRTYER